MTKPSKNKKRVLDIRTKQRPEDLAGTFFSIFFLKDSGAFFVRIWNVQIAKASVFVDVKAVSVKISI